MSLDETKYRLEFFIFLDWNVHTAIGEDQNYV